MESKQFEVSLSAEEIKEFDELCARQHVHPSQKVGDLIHGFLLAEGVKHQEKGAA